MKLTLEDGRAVHIAGEAVTAVLSEGDGTVIYLGDTLRWKVREPVREVLAVAFKVCPMRVPTWAVGDISPRAEGKPW